jgi:hypothetical protein
MKRIGGLTLLIAVMLPACYSYVPASFPDVAPAQTVRVRLAPAEAGRLSEYVKTESRTMDGTFLEEGTDSVMLEVASFSELEGTRVQTFRQRVNVARSGILDVELKALDRPKTYLVTGLAAALAVYVAIDKLAGHSGSDTQPPVPVPNDARRPRVFLRIPLGR